MKKLLRDEAAKLPPGRAVFDDAALAEVVSAIARYDIDIYILPLVTFNNEHALPSKFFDLISARLGAAIGPTANMARLAHEHGVGWVSPDFEPKSFADMLNKLTPEDIAEKQAASRRLRETLNAETEMTKLANYVDQIIALPLEQDAR